MPFNGHGMKGSVPKQSTERLSALINDLENAQMQFNNEQQLVVDTQKYLNKPDTLRGEVLKILQEQEYANNSPTISFDDVNNQMVDDLEKEI